jgi:hypothetical protein
VSGWIPRDIDGAEKLDCGVKGEVMIGAMGLYSRDCLKCPNGCVN